MTNKSTSTKTFCSITWREYCLAWGLPCVIMLITSLMTAICIGSHFDKSPAVELSVFAISFMLQILLYHILFQQLPMDIYKAYGVFRKRRRKKNILKLPLLETRSTLASDETEASTLCEEPKNAESDEAVEAMVTSEPRATEETMVTMKTQVAAAPVVPVLSAEDYLQRNNDYNAEIAEEKAKLVASIMDYVHYTMACFVSEDDMPSFCQEILRWVEDPNYTPNPANLKVTLTTAELRHFVWNIGERLGRANGYNGNARLHFIKALFPREFDSMEDESIRNFTIDADKGRIKLDRPIGGSYKFHHRDRKTV